MPKGERPPPPWLERALELRAKKLSYEAIARLVKDKSERVRYWINPKHREDVKAWGRLKRNERKTNGEHKPGTR
jgi:hypothetical protein